MSMHTQCRSSCRQLTIAKLFLLLAVLGSFATREATAQSAVNNQQPSARPRIVVSFDPPEALPDTPVKLTLRLSLPAGSQTFDLEQEEGSVFATKIELEDSLDLIPLETFVSEGVQERQEEKFAGRLVRYFEKEAIFSRKVLLAKSAKPGPKTLAGRIDFDLYSPATGRTLRVRRLPFAGVIRLAEPLPAQAPTKPEVPAPVTKAVEEKPAPAPTPPVVPPVLESPPASSTELKTAKQEESNEPGLVAEIHTGVDESVKWRQRALLVGSISLAGFLLWYGSRFLVRQRPKK